MVSAALVNFCSPTRVRFAFALVIATAIGATPVSALDPRNESVAQNMAAPYDRGSPEGLLPRVLLEQERELYRALFQAIDDESWDNAETLLEKTKDGTLHQVALAEYYTHAKSPKVSAEQIEDWLKAGVHLPQSEQLALMGAKRGLLTAPTLPRQQNLRFHPEAAKRVRPQSVQDGSIRDAIRAAILEAIKQDNPQGAHQILFDVDTSLSPSARAEWRQRVAWSYYIENDDENALALAETVAEGSGPWVAEGEWVAGLASWRLGYCALSSEAFVRASLTSTNIELTAAAHYWAHRALVRCREPVKAQDSLRAAARYGDTLYGMLARDQLGINQTQSTSRSSFSQADWRALQHRPNVRIAAALVEIGRKSLADEVLRHEAKVGEVNGYEALARLARELGLPSTQLFLAYHSPYGVSADKALRYPVASWRPKTGWRIDPALAFAHALQESSFRASAISPANARGLMQIRPGTARDHNLRLNLGASYVDLRDPEVNLAYGQRHLEMLRDTPATGGKLPKIMAAYNAGLSPIARWNTEIRDFDDPLLWMESIPYWETRGYVSIVMRNYWMYERAAGVLSPSRRALAQGQWPEFPAAPYGRRAQLQSRD